VREISKFSKPTALYLLLTLTVCTEKGALKQTKVAENQ